MVTAAAAPGAGDGTSGTESPLGFGGALKLRELGLQLYAFGLEVFEGLGLALLDGGEFGLNVLECCHGLFSLCVREFSSDPIWKELKALEAWGNLGS